MASQVAQVVSQETRQETRQETTDPWKSIMASDAVLAHLVETCRDLDVALQDERNNIARAKRRLECLTKQKEAAEQQVLKRVEFLKGSDPDGREGDTYFVAYYDGDDNKFSEIQVFATFGQASTRFEGFVEHWNLFDSLDVDSSKLGLPEGSACLKRAVTDEDSRLGDVSVVLGRASRAKPT